MQVHQIGGRGLDSNIYLIIDEVIALVDTGTGRNFEAVRRNLGKFDLEPSDIELIINTHCHYDHVGGNRDFTSASGCAVAIHELDAEPLRRGNGVITCASVMGEKLKPLKPSRLLREGDRIELGGSTLEVLHTPGHTQGSICLYEREKLVLFSGDTVFCGGIGRTDWPTGDSEALARSLRRLAGLDVRGLFPGHGPFDPKNAQGHIKAALGFLDELTWAPKRGSG
jgi:glyoxylase-like metal-dependent hydrolase (beta-lactamase superfamily II)